MMGINANAQVNAPANDSIRQTRGARLSVAPMMAWTTPAQRYFMRCISRHALLYTEMVTTGALIHGDTARFLACDAAEHPVALQLGGSDAKDMATCAGMAEDAGFDEVNVNVGCPSDRVQNGAFGACLMAEPGRVADCVAAMRATVSIPVTVKTRIGIDHQDSYAFLHDFTSLIEQAGADRLIVHARKAWLSGLSPKENRDIPPLDYERVYQLASDFPQLPMSINGGVVSMDAVHQHLNHLDGVMIGREAYRNPYFMAQIDHAIFGDNTPPPTRYDVVMAMHEYVEWHRATGGHLKDVTRHMLGLFHAQSGGKKWRRALSENAHATDANWTVVENALLAITRPTERAIA